MPKLNQKGIAQIIVLLILVAGLGASLLLAQQTQIFKPKAFESKPSSKSPISQCTSRLIEFSLDQPCSEVGNGFKAAKFSCANSLNGVSENQPPRTIEGETCRPAEQLLSQAFNTCKTSCFPIPTSIPTPIRCGGNIRGAVQCPDGYTCISKNPDVRGICVPVSSPTPEPTACIQIVTSAKNTITGECKDFPTPCDVPAGWETVASCSPQGTPSPSCAPGMIDCAAPPANCHWEGGTSCSCGKLVCSKLF